MDGSIALGATWVAIHLIGLAAAWMVRKETSGHRARLAQNSFFACLPLVALITVVGQILCLTSLASLGRDAGCDDRDGGGRFWTAVTADSSKRTLIDVNTAAVA